MNFSDILQATGRAAAAPSDAAYFEIQLPDQPHPVRLTYSAIRQLHSGLAEGTTAPGLLLGTMGPDAVLVDRLEPLPTGASGADALLAARQRHESGTGTETVLGFFRTQTSGWLEVQAADREAAAKCFSSPMTLFLMLQTPVHRPWSAVLVDLGPEGESRATGQEFFFDEYLLRHGYSNGNLIAPPKDETPVGFSPYRWLKHTWPLIALVGLLSGVITGAYSALKELTAVHPSVVVSPTVFALQLTRSGTDFTIDWDRRAAVLNNATGGRITIQDGTLERVIELTAAQLREGRLVYAPVANEMTVRLEVMTPTGTQAESIRRISWDPDRLVNAMTNRGGQKGKQIAPTPVLAPDPPAPVSTPPQLPANDEASDEAQEAPSPSK